VRGSCAGHIRCGKVQSKPFGRRRQNHCRRHAIAEKIARQARLKRITITPRPSGGRSARPKRPSISSVGPLPRGARPTRRSRRIAQAPPSTLSSDIDWRRDREMRPCRWTKRRGQRHRISVKVVHLHVKRPTLKRLRDRHVASHHCARMRAVPSALL